MRRTWVFSAQPVRAADITLHVERAEVSQKILRMKLILTNTGTTALTLGCSRFTVTLPDGQQFSSNVGGLASAVRGTLAGWGLAQAQSTQDTPPGAGLVLEATVTQGSRDLRRQPRLLIRLDDVTVNGASVDVPAVQLLAPPEAPMGEEI